MYVYLPSDSIVSKSSIIHHKSHIIKIKGDYIYENYTTKRRDCQ